MKCRNCSAENPEGNMFCGKCGAPVSVPQVSTSATNPLTPNVYFFGRKIPPFVVGILAIGVCLCMALFVLSSPSQNASLPTTTRLAVGLATEIPTSTPVRVQASPESNTPQPTNTVQPPSAPSATSIPPQVVAGQTVNIRQGPGTQFAIVGKLQNNDSAVVLGKTTDGQWFQIAYPDETNPNWVAASVVSTIGPIDAVEVVAVKLVPTVTPRQQPTATVRPPQPTAFTFGNGMKIVGTDIQAGTYRGNMAGNACYWERLSGFGGTTEKIIANSLTSYPTIVTIAKTDKGFNSTRCGGFTQDLSPITSSPTAPFSDGEYIVGKDIAPGQWRSSGGQGCYWERLSGFGGETENIIANNLINGSAIVEIGIHDAGFSSTRCGTWTKIN